MPKKPIDKLLAQHEQLNHTENMKVVSHVQREDGDWLLNTLMVEGYDVPFQFRRKKRYQTLTGARVNMTYYRQQVDVGGIEFESMKVVRVKRS